MFCLKFIINDIFEFRCRIFKIINFRTNGKENPEMIMGRNKVKIVENVSIKYNRRPGLLEHIECPFTWLPLNKRSTISVSSGDMMGKLRRLKVISYSKYFGRYEGFIWDLCIMYEYYAVQQKKDAIGTLKRIENVFLNSLHMEVDDFYNSIREAIYTVIISCQMYLFYSKPPKLDETFKQKSKEILNNKSMMDSAKSSLFGIKASFYAAYGYDAIQDAILNIDTALEKDQTNTYWIYLRASLLANLRRFQSPLYCIPNLEEIKSIEKCLKQTDDPLYLAAAGRLLIELASVFYRLHNKTHHWKCVVDSLAERLILKASAFYVDTLNVISFTAEILFQCADGFLDVFCDDARLIGMLVDEGLKQLPGDAYGHYVAGKYYHQLQQDTEKAKEHLRVSNEAKFFPAGLLLLQIECGENDGKKIDVLGRLFQLSEYSLNNGQRLEINCQIASYYVLIKRDLQFGVIYMRELMSLNPHCEQALYHKSVVVPMAGPVSLYEITMNAVYLKIKQRQYTQMELALFQEFIQRVFKMNIPIFASAEDPIDVSTEILSKGGCLDDSFLAKFKTKELPQHYKNTFVNFVKNEGHMFKQSATVIRKRFMKYNGKIGAKITVAKNCKQ